MLPAAYQMPATLVLLLSGIVACFFGHRLFRLVLALFGFIIGAFAASSVVGSSSSTYMLVAAVAGGLAGAGLLTAAYFVSVALLGAMLGVTVCHLTFPALVTLMNVLLPSSWELAAREPGILVIVLFSTAGAVLSTYIQRYVIIVGTAFAGAWTLLVGALGLAGNPLARTAAAAGTVWVLYPLDPAPGRSWILFVWVALGLAGCAVQLGWTGGSKGRVVGRKRK
jgi:hypothetical protein